MTNISGLFEGKTYFNEDISRWRVGNVITMRDMFKSASSFNQSLEQWNVGNKAVTGSLICAMVQVLAQVTNKHGIMIIYSSM